MIIGLSSHPPYKNMAEAKQQQSSATKEKRLVIPNFFARFIRSGKYRTKRDFVRAFKGDYDEDALSQFWDKYAEKVKNVEAIWPGTVDELRQILTDTLTKIKEEVKKMAEKKQTQGINAEEILKQVKEGLSSEISKVVASELSKVTDEISKCIKDGTCSRDEVEKIISAKIEELKGVSKEVQDLKNSLVHAHSTPEEVISCPTCGPAIVDAVKKMLNSQSQQVEAPKSEENTTPKEPKETEPEKSPFIEIQKSIQDMNQQIKQLLEVFKSSVATQQQQQDGKQEEKETAKATDEDKTEKEDTAKKTVSETKPKAVVDLIIGR